ncbi:MAG TPA: SUMF1/EgtB/PvdO family nonheme iron enzyme, partial [Vicinamibacteria bacterium]|nr:SUMF1/EgtB/PvdO family nonheme iron enzyme [Vicinamibacteria bacterium]
MPATADVPAGSFVMGSAAGRPDESPPHTVTVRAFRLGRTPVTNAEYAPFLAAGLAAAPPWWGAAAFAAPEQP